jgi:hypothetical protein
MARIACAVIALLALHGSAASADDCASLAGRGCAEPRFDVGHFYVGAAYSFGVGSVFFNGGNLHARELGIGGGIAVGFRMPARRLWWELGLVAGPFRDSWTLRSETMNTEWDSADPDAQSLHRVFGGAMPLHLEARFLVPLKAPYVYWASSVLPGILMMRRIQYDDDDPYGKTAHKTIASFSMILRTGVAFVLGDWWEIRLDVVGVELIFEKAFGVFYSPSFAIVLRI